MIQAGHCGLIKIGMSEDPDRRLGELQVGSDQPLRLVAVIPGVSESMLHRHFAPYRVHGEWFEPAEPLVKFVEWLYRDADELFQMVRDGADAWARMPCGGPCPY